MGSSDPHLVLSRLVFGSGVQRCRHCQCDDVCVSAFPSLPENFYRSRAKIAACLLPAAMVCTCVSKIVSSGMWHRFTCASTKPNPKYLARRRLLQRRPCGPSTTSLDFSTRVPKNHGDSLRDLSDVFIVLLYYCIICEMQEPPRASMRTEQLRSHCSH